MKLNELENIGNGESNGEKTGNEITYIIIICVLAALNVLSCAAFLVEKYKT